MKKLNRLCKQFYSNTAQQLRMSMASIRIHNPNYHNKIDHKQHILDTTATS